MPTAEQRLLARLATSSISETAIAAIVRAQDSLWSRARIRSELLPRLRESGDVGRGISNALLAEINRVRREARTRQGFDFGPSGRRRVRVREGPRSEGLLDPQAAKFIDGATPRAKAGRTVLVERRVLGPDGQLLKTELRVTEAIDLGRGRLGAKVQRAMEDDIQSPSLVGGDGPQLGPDSYRILGVFAQDRFLRNTSSATLFPHRHGAG